MSLDIKEGIAELSDLLATKGLALFAGAGISIDVGLPSWSKLLVDFMDMAEGLPIHGPNGDELRELIAEARGSIGTTAFDPIKVATVIKNKIKECDIAANKLANKNYSRWLLDELDHADPGEKHKLIISTDYKTILTSNYDLLLEEAANEFGFDELAQNTLTYKDELRFMSTVYKEIPAIIHVHGSIADLSIDQIIFTKEDYNKVILKKYGGFSFALRMIFTRYSTLFVGYSASDPHLEEIFEEISEYFPLIIPEEFPLPYAYLVVLKKDAGKILQKYKERVRTKLIIIDDFAELEYLLTELQKVKPRT